MTSRQETHALNRYGSIFRRPRSHQQFEFRRSVDLPMDRNSRIKRALKHNWILIALVIGMLLGVALGFALKSLDLNERQIKYVNFPGELLLRMLKMLILPLIVSSLISGLASLDIQTSGKMGLRTVVYYFATTFIAVFLGIVLVVSIRPGEIGEKNNNPDGKTFDRKVTTIDTILDLIRNMFPDNLIEAAFKSYGTVVSNKYKVTNVNTTINGTFTNGTLNETITIVSKGSNSQMNIIGIITISIAYGVIIGRLGDTGLPMARFFEALSEATMKLITAVIWFSPVGIIFLIAAKILETDDFGRTMQQLGMYTLTVLTGLFLHGLIILPIMFLAITRKNPFRYIFGCIQALLTALATSSSSATLPVTVENLEQKIGVDPRVTRFVLPVGATINMDGTALYEAVAAIFIAQYRNMDLDISNIIVISLTATTASIGAAGIPQAGLVTLVLVLNAVGLPAEDVSLILAVDWFLDRFRTMINVLGDALAAGAVAHLSQKELARSEYRNVRSRSDMRLNQSSEGGRRSGRRSRSASPLDYGKNQAVLDDARTRALVTDDRAPPTYLGPADQSPLPAQHDRSNLLSPPTQSTAYGTAPSSGTSSEPVVESSHL